MRIKHWGNYLSDIEKLSIKLKNDFPDIKNKFVGIYGIPRGGTIIATILSHELELPYIDKMNYPTDCDYIGKSILIVDEINDSGSTLNIFKNYWAYYGYDLIFATLCSRKGSKFKSDYNVYEIQTDSWIVFPYEKEPTEKNINWERY